MEDFFSPPPEGAVQTSNTQFLSVNYSASRTPENFANSASVEVLYNALQKGKLGFHFYDKEAGQNKPISPFTFVVLEVYSAISGFEERANGDKISYWSNRVRDTRTEPFAVFDGGKKPFITGVYSEIKPQLPDAAKWGMFLACYCVELETTVEVKVTAGVQRAMQKAIAAAEQAVGRRAKWDSVRLFNIASNDHLWIFRHTPFADGQFFTDAFERETKDGSPYMGKGDLYFSPILKGGVLQPIGNALQLHTICADLQNQIRREYDDRKQRFGKPDATPTGATTQEQFASAPTAAPTTQPAYAPPAYSNDPFPPLSSAPAPDVEPLPF